MSRESGYIKRHKSLALLVIAATLLTYNLAQTGTKLDRDFSIVQTYLLTVELVTSRSPDTRHLTLIDKTPIKNWQERMRIRIPTIGPLVDQIRFIKDSTAKVEGVYSLADREEIKFTRHARQQLDQLLKEKKVLKASCVQTNKTLCEYFTLYRGTTNPRIDVILKYSPETGDDTQSDSPKWWFVDSDTGEISSMSQIQSRLITVAVPWIGKASSAEEAYMKLREVKHQRSVKIPQVNLEVKADRATAFLSLFAVIVGVLITHSLLSIPGSMVSEIDEPWLIQLNQPFVRDWFAYSQLFLSLIGSLANILIIWCPVLIVIFSYYINMETLQLGLILTTLFLTVTLSLVGTAKFINLLYCIYSPVIRDTQKT